jgi:hypothetical protein
MQAEGKSEAFVDRLVIDLATARLLYSPMPDVVERVRSELVAIRDVLIQAFPDSAIVLTGSMFVGEGQVDFISEHPVILSDYDLIIVSRNFCSVWPPAARRRLAATLDVMPLSAHLDISLVWEPLLRKRLTTIGGAVMGGTLDISSILPLLQAPHAGNELLKAYQFLSAAPLHLKSYDLFCAKGLSRGARALLLHKENSRPRSKWIDLSSVAFIKDAIREMEPQLGPDAVDTIRRACDVILGIKSGGLTADDHIRYTVILGGIADRITFPSSRILALKHALWLLREKRPGIPRPSVGVSALNGLRSLAESWRPDGLDHDGVRKAEQIARHLCHVRRDEIDANPMSAYVCVHNLLANLADFNPHKLYYGPRSVSI